MSLLVGESKVRMPEESLRAEFVEQDETRWLLAPELQG